MNDYVVPNESFPISSSQNPGQSSSQLMVEDDYSPIKLALHQQQAKDKETRGKFDNSVHDKIIEQDTSLMNGGNSEPTVKRQTLGGGPPLSTTTSNTRSLFVSCSNKKNDNSLNEAFREYIKSLPNTQENQQQQNMTTHEQPNSNPIDEFGDKFVRTVSKIVERGKKNHRVEQTEKGEKSTTTSVGSTLDKTCEPPAGDSAAGSESIPSPTQRREQDNHIVQEIVKDFSPEGDRKILRAIGRTAAVNAAVLATTFTGGAAGAGAARLLTGGVITAKRLGDGVQQEDETEVAKSLAVYGASTTASFVGQVATGALLIGVAGAALPVAIPIAFGVGCASGITAGALSEWGVERALGEDQGDRDNDNGQEEDDSAIVKSESSIPNVNNAETSVTKDSSPCKA